MGITPPNHFNRVEHTSPIAYLMFPGDFTITSNSHCPVSPPVNLLLYPLPTHFLQTCFYFYYLPLIRVQFIPQFQPCISFLLSPSHLGRSCLVFCTGLLSTLPFLPRVDSQTPRSAAQGASQANCYLLSSASDEKLPEKVGNT